LSRHGLSECGFLAADGVEQFGAGLCYLLTAAVRKEAFAMKTLVLSIALSVLVGLPLLAALKVGDTAPDFSARASLAGKEFSFSLQDALKKGPVVAYFYPSAYTNGCDIEAHTFAEMKDQFDAAGATIIGVSLDSIARLNQFSADPAYCAGKFPVASDADAKIATSYNLTKTAVKPGQTDVRGVVIDHDFLERATFIIGKDHKIIATLSTKEDGIAPADHVKQSLEIVQKLASK
jgi:thioredoxin-dependent peroxiredoxin